MVPPAAFLVFPALLVSSPLLVSSLFFVSLPFLVSLPFFLFFGVLLHEFFVHLHLLHIYRSLFHTSPRRLYSFVVQKHVMYYNTFRINMFLMPSTYAR
jgi:hypothetical protein